VRGRRFLLLAGLAAAGTGASDVEGQVGLAARVGTLGIGAEAALDISDRLAVRGGLGLGVLLQAFSPRSTIDGIDVDLELPDYWYNVGVDYYLNSVFRVGGGVVFVTEDSSLRARLDQPVDIGGVTLSPGEIGTLTGSIATLRQAAYALIGFGRHTGAGVGLSLDVGAAFLGNAPQVTLEAVGGSYPQQDLEGLLAHEAERFEDDMKAYLKVWPILSLGLRYGV
jgi:hypothetical protein